MQHPNSCCYLATNANQHQLHFNCPVVYNQLSSDAPCTVPVRSSLLIVVLVSPQRNPVRQMQSFYHPKRSFRYRTRHQHGSLDIQTVGRCSLQGCHRKPRELCQNDKQPIRGRLLCPAQRNQPIRVSRASVIVFNCCYALPPRNYDTFTEQVLSTKTDAAESKE